MSPIALILVLAGFLAFSGIAGLIVGRAIRDRTGDLDAAAWVLLVAVAFAAASIAALEIILPRLEALLL